MSSLEARDLTRGANPRRESPVPRREAANLLSSLLLLSLSCLMVLCSARLAVAAIIQVTTTDDDNVVNGNCTLREAITAATSPIQVDSCTRGDPGADTIDVPAGTYLLTVPAIEGVLPIFLGSDMTIRGAGMSQTILDGGDATLIFSLTTGHYDRIEIRDLTVQRGRGGPVGCIYISSGDGTSLTILRNVMVRDCIGRSAGGISIDRGTVILIGSTVMNSVGEDFNGGGIRVEANPLGQPTRLTLIRSTVSHNLAVGDPSFGTNGDGGGIWVRGPAFVTILDSTFEGNEGRAGGAYRGNATLHIERSTFFNNVARVWGGAIHNAGPATIVNSTFSGNQAGLEGVANALNRGGAIRHLAGNELTPMSLQNCTIIENRVANQCAPGPGCPPFHDESIDADQGGLSITNTVLAKKEPFASNRNCSVFTPPLISGGHNFDSDGSCGLTGEGDISGGFDDGPIGLDPLLGPLADNGGPTLTHALSGLSPLFDAGGNLLCPPVDQRGFFRPRDGNNDGFADCDIGAVESQLSQVTSDFDFDGIENSQDNCPITANPDQADSGGLDGAVSDGIGDACQCGDVSDEGVIDILDVAFLKRHLAALAPGLPAPEKCRVARLGTCDATDLAVLRSALVGLPPGVERFCEAALPQ